MAASRGVFLDDHHEVVDTREEDLTMKTLLAATAVVAFAVSAAFAGDSDGYECQSHCPLAQQANTMRADGAEALAASSIVRADVAAVVARNVARI